MLPLGESSTKLQARYSSIINAFHDTEESQHIASPSAAKQKDKRGANTSTKLLGALDKSSEPSLELIKLPNGNYQSNSSRDSSESGTNGLSF